MSKFIQLAVTSAMAFSLIACSKQENSSTLNDAKSPEVLKQEVQAQKLAEAPKADKSMPLEQYQELSSGQQVMFSYLANSEMPIDYEKSAQAISAEYRGQSDDFKKRDLLNALKPRIDAEVAKAKSAKYFFANFDAELDKYDFESKAFPLKNLRDSGTYWYFYDVNAYRYSFLNGAVFNKIPVVDETMARTIESYRASYKKMTVRVYFYASSAKLGESTLMGEITRVRLYDGKGTLLAEI
ncbi:hypothetical protein AEP_00656 [Curvibacter sp. AEP1-3]|uniref:DUF4852 domain-containing protein n=1 Tax=Curvibacter sp. AEP1-3 TaxID=1844971 RepID=UPI000B3C5137|nr:DUF4852 domain-containing protein [Curvibacter sp. AEP1-3]ARV17616.1 hypothetical protein AEP_00656 [Curvibacter sp. AEP1-3]